MLDIALEIALIRVHVVLQFNAVPRRGVVFFVSGECLVRTRVEFRFAGTPPLGGFACGTGEGELEVCAESRSSTLVEGPEIK